jgi:hypothetical protein
VLVILAAANRDPSVNPDAVERLLARGVLTESLVESFTYRASANTRIPVFARRSRQSLP